MKSIWMNYASDTGCPFHRVLSPARFCGPELEEKGWRIDVGEGLPKGHDVYVFHGIPTPNAMLEIFRMQRRGAKFVWSLDDDWLTIPDWNPAKPPDDAMAMYDAIKKVADWILVSTKHLASTFADVSHKVLYAPNLVDLSIFPPVTAIDGPDGMRSYEMRAETPVRIAWVGGHTHLKDIEAMAEPLYELMGQYGPTKVVVEFFGMMPPSRLVKRYLHKGLTHRPPTPFSMYQAVINTMRPAVYLAPLAEVPFNLSKSNLRVMEAWGLLAAPVAANWGDYTCIRNGVDGRLCETPDAWYSALSRLITDHEYRCNLAIAGRTRVERQYNWAEPICRSDWTEAFAKITAS